MLTVAEIQTHLTEITYKPGWMIEAYEGRYEGPHIAIRAEVENSYRPGETILLDIHSPLPPLRTVDDLEDWLLWRLIRIESHEAREWLRHHGKPIIDPHADGADRDI